MSKVKIELNFAGIREMLKSPEAGAICEEYAHRALMNLGDGYGTSTMVGKIRINAEVSAQTYKARKENAENNTILKALR